MSEETKAPQQEKDPKDLQTPVKKRKWLRRFTWLILGLLLCITIFGFLLNGVIARWFIGDQLGKFIEKQGMHGSADIEGSLHSGFSIKNADYVGSLGIQKLKIKKAAIGYDVERLLGKQIDFIEIQNATTEIDISKFPPSEKSKNEDFDLKETLAKIRPWVTNPRISIKNLDVKILKDSQPLMAYQLGSLTHTASSDTFQIKSFQAQDKKGKSTPIQDVELSWKENSASIDRFELLPDIAIKNGNANWEDSLKGNLALQLHDAEIDLSIAEQININLVEGSINSDKIIDSLGIDLPADFIINGIDLTAKNWKEAIPLWSINAKLGVKSASYDKYTLANSDIVINQLDTNYIVSFDTEISDSPISTEIKGQWLNPQSDQWWGDTTAELDLHQCILGKIPALWEHDSSKVNLSDSQLSIHGKAQLVGNKLLSANLTADIQGATSDLEPVPSIHIQSNYSDNKAFLTASNPDSENRDFIIKANYDTQARSYEGELTLVEKSPQWITAICKAFGANISLDREVDITWSGSGVLSDSPSHDGEFSITKLFLNLPDTPTLDIDSIGRYSWPTSANIDALNIRERQWNATTSMIWNGKNIIIPALVLKNAQEPILGASAIAPLTTDTMNAKDFFAQTDPLNITLKTLPLSFGKLSEWFKFALPDPIKGTTDVYIELSGSPFQPQAKGSANLTEVIGLTEKITQPLSAHVNFNSIGDNLQIDSEFNEGDTERLTLKGLFPFLPNQWINEPGLFVKSIKAAPVEGNININLLPLSELKQFVAQLEKVEGTVSGKGNFSGSWDKPVYQLNIQADAPLIQLSEKSIGLIKDVKLNVTVDQELIVKNNLVAQINGGEFNIEGTVDINDIKKPIFDLDLNTRYAMIYRDDLLSTRANANLKLQGSLTDAIISGKIGIVESLVYKDIELIPIGVPSSEVAKVNLPSINTSAIDDGLPIPAPFDTCKLDITLLTEDPILLRGNVAKGYVQGSLKVGGTLARPEPDGTIYLNDLKARLPFSILAIDKGEIIFTPKGGILPQLKILGTSTIGSHDVNLLVHGSVSSPKTSLTSSPPLPESEIMSLLATGTTTEELANSDVAAFKAFQLFLIKAQQRQGILGGNKLFKLLLSGIKNFNLNVGETNEFTGRKFSSATIDFNKNWHFTAQVDDNQRARGLIVYVIKFR